MNRKKKFDSVELMRKLRNDLSKELANKSFEKQKQVLKQRLQKRKAVSA